MKKKVPANHDGSPVASRPETMKIFATKAPRNTFCVFPCVQWTIPSVVSCFVFSCSPSSSHRRETLLCAGLLLNRTSHPVFCRRKATALPGSLETLLHICHVLRPRMEFDARPFRRFTAAPAAKTTKAPPI
jgi:hypothetical protein